MIPADRHPTTLPPGPWVMVQRWHDLLFAHWRCPMSDLRPLIPEPIEIDTFEELNVRTYVTLDGRPGIWFFSLDCASSLAVLGARVGIYLPYFRASMNMVRNGDTIEYLSERWSMAGKRWPVRVR